MVGPTRTKKRTVDWTRILCLEVALKRVDELREEELAVAQELTDEKGETCGTRLRHEQQPKRLLDPVREPSEEDVPEGQPHDEGGHNQR